MARGLAAALFAILAAPALAADEAAAKKLEGTYEVVSATRGGKPDEKAKEVKEFVIKDGSIAIKATDRDESVKFTVDPSKKPAHIDLSPPGDLLIKGVYEAKHTAKGLERPIACSR